MAYPFVMPMGKIPAAFLTELVNRWVFNNAACEMLKTCIIKIE